MNDSMGGATRDKHDIAGDEVGETNNEVELVLYRYSEHKIW